MDGRNALRNGLIAVSLAALPLTTYGFTAFADSPSRTESGQHLQFAKGESCNQGEHKKHGKHHAKMGGRHGGALGQLTFYELQNQMVASVAALTNQPADAVRSTLKDEGMRGLMKTYDLSREALATEMAPKLSALVRAAQKDGRLTELQADTLIGEIEERAANPGQGGSEMKGEMRGKKDGDKHGDMRGGPMAAVAFMQTQNLTIDTLAELTGKSASDVRMVVSELGSRLAMKNLNVDREAFAAAFKARTQAAIDAALAEGSITADQAKAMKDRMDKEESERQDDRG